MPLVVHHLLPTNHRNHLCRRCHSSTFGPDSAHRSTSSTKWFSLNASSAFGNVITIHISDSACCFASGPAYAPVIVVDTIFSHTASSVHDHFGTGGWTTSVQSNFGTRATCRISLYYFGTRGCAISVQFFDHFGT